MFRVSGKDDMIGDADTLDQARERLRREEPGLNRVDDIRADLFPSRHSSQAWGVLLQSKWSRIRRISKLIHGLFKP